MRLKLFVTMCLIFTASVVASVQSSAAVQSTPYVLTDFPLSIVPPDSGVWVKWTGLSRTALVIPDSGTIYYSGVPGGGVMSKYKDSVTVFAVDTVPVGFQNSYVVENNVNIVNLDGTRTSPLQRGIKFRPKDQHNMGAGIYYFVVALKGKTSRNTDTTLFWSDEMKLIVRADQASVLYKPDSIITDVSPTFTWSAVPGVPYYHIMVSDKPFQIDLQNKTVSNMSVIWEAITSSTQMTYGAPDPSGTITANPPPISPGKTYNWLVLGNYGNAPEYSSFTPLPIPKTFTVSGTTLTPPTLYWPLDTTLRRTKDSTITFKWKNTRTDSVNTYKIYLYTKSSDLNGIDAQLVVWNDEITAGAIAGDTATATINAKSTLKRNTYTWKVIAVDKKGFGTSGPEGTFKYDAPTGTIVVNTAEQITVGNTVVQKSVGLVDLKIDVLDGSMEAPLLFYTDVNGYLSRTQPAGRYKLTMEKTGFLPTEQTVTITDSNTTTITAFMKRPDASVFGKVVDDAGQPVGLAIVQGVSDNGDSVSVQTDPKGGYVLSCAEASWHIWAEKMGYDNSAVRDTFVTFGENVDMTRALVIKHNNVSVYGQVKNGSGVSINGATVDLYSGDQLISEIPSTPSDGSYSFVMSPGTYTLKAYKIGFTSYQATFSVTSNTQRNISLSSGAALIRGYVIGKSWDGRKYVFAPITNATVVLADTLGDTVSGTTDKTYGKFGISIAGGRKYSVYAFANGFDTSTLATLSPALGATLNTTDTILSFAVFTGHASIPGVGVAANVSVTLADSVTGQVVASSKTDALGFYQIGSIPDGLYSVTAGRVGLVLDSVMLKDSSGALKKGSTLVVQNGIVKADNGTGPRLIDSVNIVVSPGSKSVTWFGTHDGVVVPGRVKVSIPFDKSIAAGLAIDSVGIGTYQIGITPSSDSLVDCSRHSYTIVDSPDSIFKDTVDLPFVHHRSDTTRMIAGTVSCTLSIAKGVVADSISMYYRDIGASKWQLTSVPDTVIKGTTASRYVFKIPYSADGSQMLYWFRILKGADVYGSSFRTYQTYVSPDTSVLSKIEITPSSDDTITYPARSTVNLVFRGYFGTKFQRVKSFKPSDVVWTFDSAFGCSTGQVLADSEGVHVVVSTLNGTGKSFVRLRGTLAKASPYKVASSLASYCIVKFRISKNGLDSIVVQRINSDGRAYITTSSVDIGSYVATGLDSSGGTVSVTPTWSLIPSSAGTVSSNGVFSPSPTFSGYARIVANASGMTGEYNPQVGKYLYDRGQKVVYIFRHINDTVNTGNGCKVYLPAGVVDSGQTALLQIERPWVKDNKLNLVTAKGHGADSANPGLDLVSDAYDITELNNVPLNVSSSDSINVSIGVPAQFAEEAKSSPDHFAVGLWSPDSIRWSALSNSEMSSGNSSVAVNTTHFSRYGMMRFANNEKGSLRISPNPFSPYVTPRLEYGADAQKGTCLHVAVSSKMINNITLKIQICTYEGTIVASAVMYNAASSQEYFIWWDGRETSRDVQLGNETGLPLFIGDNSGRMCRNGRYFVIVTMDDSHDVIRYRKELVLFK